MKREDYENLIRAYHLMTCSDLLICILDNGRDLTKEELSLLRDYIPDAVGKLEDFMLSMLTDDKAQLVIDKHTLNDGGVIKPDPLKGWTWVGATPLGNKAGCMTVDSLDGRID